MTQVARITRKNPLEAFTPEVPVAVSEAAERRRGMVARGGLSPREARFVTGYLHHGNAVRAMSEAGYEIASKRLADTLLERDDIAKVVDEQVAAISDLSRVTHARVVAEHANIAFADPADLMAMVEGGGIDELPPHVRAAIRKVKVRRVPGTDETEIEIDLYDKQRSLDALSKVLRITDDDEGEAATSFSKLLVAALRKLGDNQ